LLKATRDAGELAHRVGVTTVTDLSFGTIPGGYQAYQTAAAEPDFPVRVVLNPLISIFQKGEIADKGGLDYLAELHKYDTDRLSFGGVKFIVDGRSRATPDCFSGPTTTRHSPMGSRTFRKRT
jgi:predicted amidohydrolase YtcJ